MSKHTKDDEELSLIVTKCKGIALLGLSRAVFGTARVSIVAVSELGGLRLGLKRRLDMSTVGIVAEWRHLMSRLTYMFAQEGYETMDFGLSGNGASLECRFFVPLYQASDPGSGMDGLEKDVKRNG